MALRPFTRHSKNPADDEAALDAGGEVGQFFSNGPRSADTSSSSVDQGRTPVAQARAAVAAETADAGWYADASDPETKRYWDGHHWTGQTMRVVTEGPRDDGPASGPAVSAAQAGLPPDQPEPAQPTPPLAVSVEGDSGDGDAAEGPDGDAAGDAEGEIGDTTGALAGGTSSVPVDSATTETTGSPAVDAGANGETGAPEATGEADRWFAEIARAVGRAQEMDSPEAWQEAARVADVVSDVAQTMRAVAEAELEAETAARAAEEATRQAAIAKKTAAEANDTVAQTAETARVAAEEAGIAARAADEAKRAAERAAREVPRSAESATVAAKVAADAERNARSIGEIVAAARLANTQEAWADALRLVTGKSETRRDPAARGADPSSAFDPARSGFDPAW